MTYAPSTFTEQKPRKITQPDAATAFHQTATNRGMTKAAEGLNPFEITERANHEAEQGHGIG